MGMQLSLYSLSDQRVDDLLADPPLVLDILDGEEADVEEFELDKAWHAVHHLLTGSAWEGEAPLNFICQGGQEVGDIDTGYGPARALGADDVLDIANALEGIDADTLAQRFDPEEMEKLEIYPSIWTTEPEADALEFCTASFTAMKDFIDRTAERGYGMLICMR